MDKLLPLTILSGLLALAVMPCGRAAAQLDEPLTSGFEAHAPAPLAGGGAVVEVRVHRAGAPDEPLPLRVIVTASDGEPADGAGRGLYADGRFFADGGFTVAVPPGTTKIELRSGPNYVPLTFEVEAVAGHTVRANAWLARWFAPEEHGWYSGDNHVHTQHDATAVIQTGTAFTALQGRAQGLSYLTQASAPAPADETAAATTDTFLFLNAREFGVGAYVGHLNTPGITEPLRGVPVSGPLPVREVVRAAHAVGGAVTYTHPLSPPQQLHWMGATQAYSDAVLGAMADAMDVDTRATEQLWFALLNLGNRLSASGCTDAALERRQTYSPGDKRFYTQAPELTAAALTAGLRAGQTFATNGGPVYPFFTIDDQPLGSELPADGTARQAQLELHSLYPLRSVQLIRRGQAVHTFDAAGQQGRLDLVFPFTETERAWYVVRAEDERGNWALTSPIYFEPATPPAPAPAHTLLFEISNATRMVQLRQDFYAHIIATVSPDDALTAVELLRDGQVVRRFAATDGNEIGERTPVTGGEGEYQPGWLWHPDPAAAPHFQADWPVAESGWYAVRAATASGRMLQSDEVQFDAANPNSSTISVAHLASGDTSFTRWGYGEEMPLAEVLPPYEGDHWWYFGDFFWRQQVAFGPQTDDQRGGASQDPIRLFRSAAAAPLP